MAVYSMTGYASAQATAEKADEPASGTATLGLEIRSVNSRFLDLAFKLPEELRAHEAALRELVTSRLKRGKVELRAAIGAGGAEGISIPSARLIQRLNSAQDAVRAWLPGARELSVADVLRMAGSQGDPAHDWQAQLLALADQVIQALQEARAREGARLATTLNGCIAQLRALTQRAVPLVPQLVAQQRERFLARWQEALGATGGTAPEAAQDRALAEATAFAIRIDVAEELARMGSHLDEAERLLAQGGEIGKRLDFLIQEMHREANTLGSKSAALEMTRIGVDMKVLVEQMREQVQNIE